MAKRTGIRSNPVICRGDRWSIAEKVFFECPKCCVYTSVYHADTLVGDVIQCPVCSNFLKLEGE